MNNRAAVKTKETQWSEEKMIVEVRGETEKKRGAVACAIYVPRFSEVGGYKYPSKTPVHQCSSFAYPILSLPFCEVLKKKRIREKQNTI